MEGCIAGGDNGCFCGIARDSDVVVVVLVLLATSEREREGSSTFWLFGEPRSAQERSM